MTYIYYSTLNFTTFLPFTAFLISPFVVHLQILILLNEYFRPVLRLEYLFFQNTQKLIQHLIKYSATP